MNKKTKIPQFKNYQEEAEWWDTHDPLDYRDPEAPVIVTRPKSKTKDAILAIRLSQELLNQISQEAEKRGIGASTLGRMIIHEHYKHE